MMFAGGCPVFGGAAALRNARPAAACWPATRAGVRRIAPRIKALPGHRPDAEWHADGGHSASSISGCTRRFLACSLLQGATGDRLRVHRSQRPPGVAAGAGLRQRPPGASGLHARSLLARLMAPFELGGEDEERELVLVLGVALTWDRPRPGSAPRHACRRVPRASSRCGSSWKRTLAVALRGPGAGGERAGQRLARFDQVLGSRMWARRRFLPAGRRSWDSATSSRTRLALLHARLDLVRRAAVTAGGSSTSPSKAMCCTAASPVDRGVRTHFSDDYLWLPLGGGAQSASHRRYRRACAGGAPSRGRSAAAR